MTNPLAARLCVSSRASQQATPSASNAAPATRPRGMLAPEISAPSSSRTTIVGTAIKANPVAASMMAVSVRKRFIMFRAKGRRLLHCLPRGYLVSQRLVRGKGESFLRGLLFRRRQLRWAELEGELVDCPGEAKRQCVAVVHRRSGIHSDVEGFVDGHHQWDRVLDRLFS